LRIREHHISNMPIGLGDQRNAVINRARFDSNDQQPKELHYFAIQGLGELPRLLLEASKTPYDSIMYFGTGAHKAFAPFGQMPCYKGPELGTDFIMAESHAISRHIAREVGLYGSTPKEQALNDMLWELGNDIIGKKEEAHKDAMSDKLRGFLDGARKILGASGGDFLTGSTLQMGDIGVFNSLQRFELVKPGYLKDNKYDDLKSFMDRVAGVPQIEAYLNSERRLPLTQNELGKGHSGDLTGYVFVTDPHASTFEEEYKPSN